MKRKSGFTQHHFYAKSGAGFTIIELLIIIGVLAIISTTTVLVINPVQLIAQSRDAQRISDIERIDTAIQLNKNSLDETLDTRLVDINTVYVSLPDTNSNPSDNCGTNGEYALPTLTSGWQYRCAASSTNLRNIDGNGWLPIVFTSVSTNSLTTLPVDPINTVTGGYYTYTQSGLATNLQSDKYISEVALTDGGTQSNYYETAPITWIGASWACGNALVDSRDSKSYSTVLIGSQCWMAQHINVGTKITSCTNGYVGICTSGGDTVQNQTNNATIEKYCYSDTESNCTSDGGLYQWDEAMQYAASCNGTGAPPDDACATLVQGICPVGWHIPSYYEYTTLEKNVGSNPDAFAYNTNIGSGVLGTDEGANLKVGGSSGFEGLLAGERVISSVGNNDGLFAQRGLSAYLWSSLENGLSFARVRILISGVAGVYQTSDNKPAGFSVRCLKD